MSELKKMLAAKERSQAIGDFLEWAREKHSYLLAAPHKHTDECYLYEWRYLKSPQCGMPPLIAVSYSIERLLAEFFEIDLGKVEAEKRALLKEISNL